MPENIEKWRVHDPKTLKQLEKAGYGIYNHSAVEFVIGQKNQL